MKDTGTDTDTDAHAHAHADAEPADDGEDIIEYALLAAFISIAAVATVRLIGPLLLPYFNSVIVALTP